MTNQSQQQLTSQRPYLIRALHEWCSDNGLTPYLAVRVNDFVRVPREYVKEGQIILNISWDATNALRLGNEFIEFKARFGGALREIVIPVGRVVAIYAKETGQGIPFAPEESDDLPPPSAAAVQEEQHTPQQPSATALRLYSVANTSKDGAEASLPSDLPPAGGRTPHPGLTRVK